MYERKGFLLKSAYVLKSGCVKLRLIQLLLL